MHEQRRYSDTLVRADFSPEPEPSPSHPSRQKLPSPFRLPGQSLSPPIQISLIRASSAAKIFAVHPPGFSA